MPIVLDPPAFIKRKKDIPRGQAAYRKLNQMAMRLLERDALLVSCSCSYHLGADELHRADPVGRRATAAASCRFSTAAASRPIIRCTRRFRKRAI